MVAGYFRTNPSRDSRHNSAKDKEHQMSPGIIFKQLEIGHPAEDGEVRSFEKSIISDPLQRPGHIAELMLHRVANFEKKHYKRVSRLFVTMTDESILVEAFYKDIT
jgi:hypothetical protein